MTLQGERHWYATPVQKGAVGHSRSGRRRDILLDWEDPHGGYHPGQTQTSFDVLPRFDSTTGVQQHRAWPPPPDQELVRAGIHPTSVKVGYPAPGYEAERYTGTSVPPWSQPSWYQGNRSGRSNVFEGLDGWAVSPAVGLLGAALAVSAGVFVVTIAWDVGMEYLRGNVT